MLEGSGPPPPRSATDLCLAGDLVDDHAVDGLQIGVSVVELQEARQGLQIDGAVHLHPRVRSETN